MKEETDPQKKEKQSVTIDLAEFYTFSKEDLTLDIQSAKYSNLAFIQVTHRDVFIDFLEMPGIKKDSKMVVPGTRIFMSFSAAQRLSEALSGVLERVHKDGGMEQYTPAGTEKDVSTKVTARKRDQMA